MRFGNTKQNLTFFSQKLKPDKVANRLSADPTKSVLLVEQGPYTKSGLITAPGMAGFGNSTHLYATWFKVWNMNSF